MFRKKINLRACFVWNLSYHGWICISCELTIVHLRVIGKIVQSQLRKRGVALNATYTCIATYIPVKRLMNVRFPPTFFVINATCDVLAAR